MSAIALQYLYLQKSHPSFLPQAFRRFSLIATNLVDKHFKKHSTRKLTKGGFKIDSYLNLQHSLSQVFDRVKDRHLAKFAEYLESKQIYASRVDPRVGYLHFRQLWLL